MDGKGGEKYKTVPETSAEKFCKKNITKLISNNEEILNTQSGGKVFNSDVFLSVTSYSIRK